jgi:hypothetical protein
MIIRKATKKDLNKFIKTQKEAFPNLNSKKQKDYFNKRIKNKQILILENNKNYLGHLSFGRYDIILLFKMEYF